ncbi:MAG: hypothetical protein HQ559_04850, partial [Lentisphaerae bacterium]|nr:hypothetical protein [Lentisphaerota bacterium]
MIAIKKIVFCLLGALVLGIGLRGVSLAGDRDAEFEQLKETVQQPSGGATEQEAMQFLLLALDLGRPVDGALAIKPYLVTHRAPQPELLRLAADVARQACTFDDAITRYKRYLREVAKEAPTPENSGALADLVRLQMEMVDDYSGAFNALQVYGATFRKDPRISKFDRWFVDSAMGRADRANQNCKDAARHLLVVFREKLPLEMERLVFWGRLDRLMASLYDKAREDRFAPLQYLDELASLVRGDERLKLRYALYARNLEFLARSAGKTPEQLNEEYGAVIEKARAYFAASPTSETLRDIVYVLSDGHRNWSRQVAQSQALFTEMFPKLSASDKTAILSWTHRPRLANAAQWASLGAAEPEFFRNHPAVRAFSLDRELPGPAAGAALYTRAATFMTGVPTDAAAAVNALAAGLDDPGKAIAHLFKKESWHLGFTRYRVVFTSHLWPAYKQLLPRERTSRAEETKWLAELGKRAARTPVALFDYALCREYLRSAVAQRDPAGLQEALASIRWVPFTAWERRQVFETPHAEFKRWRSEAQRDKESALSGALASAIDKVFTASLAETAKADLSRAPSALCGRLARVLMAQRAGDAAAYVGPARQVYAGVKTFNVTRPAYGAAAFDFILDAPMNSTTRKPVVEILDFQCEVLADQLKQYAPGAAEERIRRAFALTGSGRYNWQYSPREERESLRKVNDVVVEAMLRQMDSGTLWSTLYDWYLRLRLGRNRHDDYRLDVVDRIIAELKKGEVKGLPSVYRVMSYINNNYFTGAFREKYDTQRDFEAAAARDMLARKTLDYGYYQYGGRDVKGDVCTAAATLLLPFDVYPLGYGGVKPPCEKERVDYWYVRALSGYGDADVRGQLSAKLGAAYGTQRFDRHARHRGLGQGPYDLEKKADIHRYIGEVVGPYLDRCRSLADRQSLSMDFSFMRHLKAAELSDQELTTLGRIFAEFMPPNQWQSHYNMNYVISFLHEGLIAGGREADLYALIPSFWAIAQDRNPGFYDMLTGMATTLDEAGRYGLAYAYGQAGLTVLSSRDREGLHRLALQDATARARREIGTVIPVPESDPKYPVFMAQSYYYDQDMESAWRQYRGGEHRVPEMVGQLDPDFCMWLVERHTDLGEFEAATQLALSILKWIDDTRIAIDPEVHGQILIRHASIAFAQEEYPRAKAQLERVTASQMFEDTQARLEAGLKLAEIDRLTENYDGALQRLAKIKRKANAYIQTRADIEIAKVMYAQEDYAGARDALQDVIGQSPQNVDAKLMLGQVDLKLKNLMDARDLPIGIEGHRHEIVPGKMFKVGLHDRNASIVGRSEVIPLRIWTDSGDEEVVNMLPQGDVRRKFQGQIMTVRAALEVDDQVLQVLGDDNVHYDFTEEFKKNHNIRQSKTNVLRVVSDGSLQASSGKLLTEEELEKQRVETTIRARLQSRLGMRQKEVEAVALSEQRKWDQIKPGHRINVRVMDVDHSVTAEPDELAISVSTASGDSIGRVPLRETEGHSGDFRGRIETAPAQATAFASDSGEGRDPNFAISPKKYPAWMGATEIGGNRVFGVDLNDNVSLGRMRIVAGVEDHKLRRFALRTGYKRDELELIGLWPGGFGPWDGSLDVRLYKYFPPVDEKGQVQEVRIAAMTPESLGHYIRQAGVERTIPSVTLKKTVCALDWETKAGGHAPSLTLAASDTYIVRMRGAFYVPLRSVRTFELARNDMPPASEEEEKEDLDVHYAWTIDGDGPESNREPLGPNVIKRSFEKGVHVLDVFVVVRTPDQKVSFEIRSDATSWGPRREMKRCDASMFDPEREPRIRSAVYRAPATIKASEDGDEFDVTFSNTQARIVSMVITGYETDAPAVEKVELRDTEGRKVLPTPEDFMDLRQNDILEVLP